MGKYLATLLTVLMVAGRAEAASAVNNFVETYVASVTELIASIIFTPIKISGRKFRLLFCGFCSLEYFSLYTSKGFLFGVLSTL